MLTKRALSLSPPIQSPLSNLIASTTSNLPSSHARHLALPIEILHNLLYQHAWTDLKLHYVSHATNTLHDLPLPNPSSGASLANGASTPSTISASSTSTNTPTSTPNLFSQQHTYLLSGLPPKHTYIHPDLQTHLLTLSPALPPTSLAIQREFVIPLSLAQTSDVNVRWLASIFDALPEREVARRVDGSVLELPALDAARRGGREDKKNGQAEHANGGSMMGSHQHGQDKAEKPKHTNEQGWQDPKRVLMAMKARDGGGGDGTVAYYVCLEGEVKPRQNG